MFDGAIRKDLQELKDSQGRMINTMWEIFKDTLAVTKAIHSEMETLQTHVRVATGLIQASENGEIAKSMAAIKSEMETISRRLDRLNDSVVELTEKEETLKDITLETADVRGMRG